MKKVLVLLIVVSMLCSLAMGCSKAPTTMSTDTPASNAGVSPESEVGKKYTITLWDHLSTEQRIVTWERVIEAFAKENPNITVNCEQVLWGDYQPKLINAIETGTAPDLVVNAETTWASAYQIDGLAPMDEIFKKVDAEQDILDSLCGAYSKDGHQWAIPHYVVGEQLFYRPSMFKAAGLEPPTTWKELVDCAQKLTIDANGDGKVDQYGIGMPAGRTDLTENTYAAFMGTAGIDVFAKDGSCAVNTPEHIACLQLYKDLYACTPKGASGWSWGELEMNWTNGVFAMLPYASPCLTSFYESGNYDIDVVPLPTPDGTSDSYIHMAQSLSMTKQCVEKGNEAAAGKFIEFIMQPENLWILTVCAEPLTNYPATQTCTDLMKGGYFVKEYFPTPNYDHTEGTVTRSFYDKAAEVASQTIANGFAFGHKYGPVNENFASMYGAQIWTDMVQKVVLDNVSPADAAAWAQSTMEDINK